MNVVKEVDFLANDGMNVDLQKILYEGKTYHLARAEYGAYGLKTAVNHVTIECWERAFQEGRNVEHEIDACLKARNDRFAVLTYASASPVDPAEFRQGLFDQCDRAAATFFTTFVAFKKVEEEETPLFRVGIAQGYDAAELPLSCEKEAKAYLEDKNISPLYIPSPNEVQIGVVPTFDSEGNWNHEDYYIVKLMACALALKIASEGHKKPYNWTHLKDGSYFDSVNLAPVERITVTNPVAHLYSLEDEGEQGNQRLMLVRKAEALHQIGLKVMGYLAPKDLDPRNYGASPREVWGIDVSVSSPNSS